MPSIRRRIAVLAASVLIVPGALVLGAAPAHAAEHTVTNQAELNSTILSAGSGDTIVFGANIVESVDMPTIDKDLTFDGAGFEYQASGSINWDIDGADVTIRNLSLLDTGVDVNGGSINLENVTSTGVTSVASADVHIAGSTFDGGVDILANANTVVIQSSHFFLATGGDYALEVDIIGGTLDMTSVTAQAPLGSGIVVFSTSAAISLSDVTLSDNNWSGFYISAVEGSVHLSGLTASTTSSGCGVAMNLVDLVASVENASITDNSDGLCVFLDEASLMVSSTTATGNSDGVTLEATSGSIATFTGLRADENTNDGMGAYLADASELVLTESTVNGNSNGATVYIGEDSTFHASSLLATDNSNDGLAIRGYDGGGQATVSGSTFADNVYGIYVTDDDTVVPLHVSVEDSTVSNSERIGVLADLADSMSLALTNVTVSGAGWALIDLYGDDNSSVEIAHSTIVGGGTRDGGIVVHEDSSVSVTHTIVHGSEGGDADDLVVVDDTASLEIDYSLVGSADTASLAAVAAGVGNLAVGLNPQLGALADNGGPTLTHLPGELSPVLESGNASITGAPAYDQRGSGFDRVVGVIDIGAIERPASLIATGSEAMPLVIGGLMLLVLGGGVVAARTMRARTAV